MVLRWAKYSAPAVFAPITRQSVRAQITMALGVHSHEDDLAGLRSGDACLVRWQDGATKTWYRCTVLKCLPGRCIVRQGDADAAYEVSWEMDEVLAKPAYGAYQYIHRHPNAVCIELNRRKYLVPHGQVPFAEAMNHVFTIAGYRPPAFPPGASVDAVANTYEFNKIVFG